MTDTMYKIPHISEVDFSDIDAICGYQFMLCKIFEREGGFQLPLVMNNSIREVQSQGLIWLKEIRILLDDILISKRMNLSVIPDLLESYDFFFRVCHGKDDSEYIREIRLKTVNCWIKGDSSISRTDVVLELLKEINRDNRTLKNRYSSYALQISGEWIEDLVRYGKFQEITLLEAYHRLSYLIKENLFAYLGNKEQFEYKTRWIKIYTLTEVELEKLDTPTLTAYINFAKSVAQFEQRNLQDITTQYHHLLTHLSSRPDIHPFLHETLEIELTTYRKQTA